MELSAQLAAAIFTLLLPAALQPTAGGSHHPLLVLDGYEEDGIRLKCLSERLFAEVQVVWENARGENVTGTPLTHSSTANASSSIILKPGSGNSASCKVIDKALRTSTESSVVIADVFFPATSPWLAALVVMLLLSVLLLLSAIYRLRKNKKIAASEKNAQRQLEEEIEQLQKDLDEEKETSEKENQELQSKIEKIQVELGFRRARSHAVNITLDENCKHPSLTIKEKNRVAASTQLKAPLKALVVAIEGFSRGKHYWEVEVGDKSEWELGVVCEKVRNGLRSNTTAPGGKLFSLRFSQGEYILTGEDDVRRWKPCTVVGVLLDQECSVLSFFDVEEKCLLDSLNFYFPGSLYPFFSPGSDGKWLGVRRVTV